MLVHVATFTGFAVQRALHQEVVIPDREVIVLPGLLPPPSLENRSKPEPLPASAVPITPPKIGVPKPVETGGFKVRLRPTRSSPMRSRPLIPRGWRGRQSGRPDPRIRDRTIPPGDLWWKRCVVDPRRPGLSGHGASGVVEER
jgi:hypothetical protein